MSVEVRPVADPEEWDDYVSRSPQTTPFYRYDALSAVARHSGSRLHLLGGFKGQEPVGLFPAFELRKAGVSTLFSPPPFLKVPSLGPALLNVEKLKPRKREKRNRRFVDGAMEWFDDRVAPRYVNVVTGPEYADVRPLQWGGFDVEVIHTYHVDLTTDEEDLLMECSSGLRKKLRDHEDSDVTVAVGDREDARHIVEEVERRYEEQDLSFPDIAPLVVDLYDRLPEGYVRPYVATDDGEFLGGTLVLDDGRTAVGWLGGAKSGADVPVNELVDWRSMADARDRGAERFDFVGADIPRLNEYKAKFAPDLKSMYVAERANPAVRLAATLYRRVR